MPRAKSQGACHEARVFQRRVRLQLLDCGNLEVGFGKRVVPVEEEMSARRRTVRYLGCDDALSSCLQVVNSKLAGSKAPHCRRESSTVYQIQLRDARLLGIYGEAGDDCVDLILLENSGDFLWDGVVDDESYRSR